MEIASRAKNKPTQQLCNFTPGYTQKKWVYMSTKKTHTRMLENVLFIHNRQHPETTQVSLPQL